MVRSPALHHLAIRVLNGPRTCELFRRCYGFEVVATRRTSHEQQWVLMCGLDIFFLISQAVPAASELDVHACVSAAAATVAAEVAVVATTAATNDGDVDAQWFEYPADIAALYAGDTVYDVCLQVKSVAEVLARIPREDEIKTPLRRLEDEHGFVEYAVVKSCVGNVYHTILNKDGYRGTFLPGFVAEPRVTDEQQAGAKSALDCIDHLAYCVEQGMSKSVLEWYEQRFGMKRFLMNRAETASGCELESIKLKMYAMEYWKCAETGLRMPGGGISFVVGETMDPTVKNQITTFLGSHGGPGVQHVAFYTQDILTAAAELRRKGVLLVQPPSVYYSEPEKHKEILDVGVCPKQLEDAGVLLDTEADSESRSDSYLLQVFTERVFATNIFFLELIHRHGARGFGAGNVTALFKAFERYLSDRKRSAGATGSLPEALDHSSDDDHTLARGLTC